jgi:predicted amidohydrolase
VEEGYSERREVVWYAVLPLASLRVALAQQIALAGDVDANVTRAASVIADAAASGAHLVAFPELFLTGYELALLARTPHVWIEEEDTRLEPIRRVCAATGVTAILSAPMRTGSGAKVIGAPVIGPSGDVGVSFKQYLHDSETVLFSAGKPIAPFEVNGWRVAIALCFDASKPRHAECAARDGADLYVSCSLYDEAEVRRADLQHGARAMDNRIFSALVNYAGTTGGSRSCGMSGVWGPRGDLVARAIDARATVVVADLDAEALRPFRSA